MDYNNLEVYKKSSSLFPKIYRIVRSWEVYDQREIGGQIIRSANSIHANLAEGINKSPKDFKRYITTSIGSCDELKSHINDALNIGLINQNLHNELIENYTVVSKQLTKLRQNWK